MENSEGLKEDRLTLQILARVLKLSKLSIANIFRTIVGQKQPTPEEELSVPVAVFLLLADRFERLPFLEPEQRAVLLSEIWSSLFQADNFLRQQVHVVFIDNSYCTWTGQTRFLDMKTGESVEKLPHPALETIGYNLNELYRRGLMHAQTSQKRAAHVNKQRDRSMEEQGYVRVGPADDVFGQVRDGSAGLGPDNDSSGN